IASETALHRFDLETGKTEDLVPLEAHDPRTRSNDGRADPWGGFWIGTMAKTADAGIGALYRYYKGELRTLYTGVIIPNATCFSADATHLYFADTATRKVTRTRLDKNGWPQDFATVFVDLGSEYLNPDGAVFDAAGNLWLAEWGAARVSCYAPDGTRLRTVAFPAQHTSCPAFGGEDLTTLFCTSALQGVSAKDRTAFPLSGQTFTAEGIAKGLPEHRVIL
ncbi:MAG: SMP-30/gluconolactonase/LRE family protein, partial [Paracoccaceae bacterium]|nr:SMP-30/gluconolactonase/LRE family protein [Paracoccaceae bacterium]